MSYSPTACIKKNGLKCIFLSLVLLTCGHLTACGQKAGLYLPEAENTTPSK